MKTIVCTLFEGHYHHGVAALCNSLFRNGFRGVIYVGYRGDLPIWASKATKDSNSKWLSSWNLKVYDDFILKFIKVDTDFHLTNYKPDFMLSLWSTEGKDANMIVYFDPDIVVKTQWEFFERWINSGVALVQEISGNIMTPTHPIRREWAQVAEACDLKVVQNLHYYINGGFCGVSAQHINFLKNWSEIIHCGIKSFGFKPKDFMPYNRTHIFFASDQDALNIAAMCSEYPLSEVGPEGMDFVHGGWLMSHAVGRLKPWRKRFLVAFIDGKIPSAADKAFWANTKGPLRSFSNMKIKFKRLAIYIAAFGGRFYRRY